MGIIATDTSQTVEFSLAEDQGPDYTIFLLRPLDMRERVMVSGKVEVGTIIKSEEGEEDPVVDRGTITPASIIDGSIWAVRLGVTGWRNFLTAAGKPLEAQVETVVIPGIGTRTVLTEECILRNLTKAQVDELSAKILNMSSFSRGERKN